MVDIMTSSVQRIGADGIDLVQYEGCGSQNLVKKIVVLSDRI